MGALSGYRPVSTARGKKPCGYLVSCTYITSEEASGHGHVGSGAGDVVCYSLRQATRVIKAFAIGPDRLSSIRPIVGPLA